MCVSVVIPLILDVRLVDEPAGVTQEEGHTGFLMYLSSAVLTLIFLARRIQPFLSLADRDVEFCVLTNYRNILCVRPAGECIFFAENDHPGGNSEVGGGYMYIYILNTPEGKVWSCADFKRPPYGFLCVLYSVWLFSGQCFACGRKVLVLITKKVWVWL